MSNLSPGEQTRAQFMVADGQELYNAWTRTIVEATVTDEFLADFPEQVRQSRPKDRLAHPKEIFSAERVKGQLSRAMQEVDEAEGITRAVLMPGHNDIVKYTSANYFGDGGKRSDAARFERVFKHAHDGMQFGLGVSAGFVFDSFLEVYIQADELGVLQNDTGAVQKQAELERFMGPMWNSDYNLPPDEHDYRFIERSVDLQKLAFIARSLIHNESAINCLVDLSKTGFGVYSGRAARIGDEHNLRMVWDKKMWRSVRLGIASEHFRAVMPYDEASQTFSILPQVARYLGAAMEHQNEKGLNRSQKEAAGLKKFKQDFTIGCPVAAEIPTVARAMGQAVQSVADYHRQ